jgi:hypothetical protein
MKRLFGFIILLFLGISCYAQVNMPEQMKKSILLIRPGILDLNETTVEEFFLNKTFIAKEQLDGTIATCKYGKVEIKGNYCYFGIDIVSGNAVNATITFVLLYQDKTSLIDTIVVTNYQTGESAESSDFSEKYQLLLFFNNLIQNNE